jgi:hypothetical protein
LMSDTTATTASATSMASMPRCSGPSCNIPTVPPGSTVKIPAVAVDVVTDDTGSCGVASDEGDSGRHRPIVGAVGRPVKAAGKIGRGVVKGVGRLLLRRR